MLRLLILAISFLVFCRSTVAQDRLDEAISRATSVLQAGVKNYPEHRSCFSCHHQALPLFAFSIGSLGSENQRSQFYSDATTKSVVDFTLRAFTPKIETLNAGGEIGGRALTVAYGLWTFDLAGTESNPTTQAMVENLLKTQDEHGAWNFQSLRPPAASSRLMATAVAVYGLRSFGADTDSRLLEQAYRKAQQFSHGQTPEHHEDLIGQIWLESMILEEQGRAISSTSAESVREKQNETDLVESTSTERDRLLQLGQKLVQAQHADGGWAQAAEMQSDAYATGQALIMLCHLAGIDQGFDPNSAIASGTTFLLNTQQPDGSWFVASRSKPVQVFFDNGDPHGKDQFISTMATSWATAALRESKYRTKHPLTSPRVAARLSRQSK